MIERRGGDFNKPDEPVLVVKGKRDQWLGPVATPCSVGYPQSSLHLPIRVVTNWG